MKKIIIFGSILIVVVTALSGCIGNQTATEKEDNKEINFDSDVLELIDSNIDVKKNNDEIYLVEVALYFKSIQDKTIEIVTYVVDFCDKYDNVLYSKSYSLRNVPANYRVLSPDVFSYDGEDVEFFDHINLYVESYELIG